MDYKSKSDIASLVVTAIIVSIMVIAIVIPVVQSGLIKEENTQENYQYFATNNIGEYEYTVTDNKLVCNGTELGTSSANILSDKFKMVFYNGTMFLVDTTLTSTPTIVKFIVHEDGSYEYFTNASTSYTSTTNIEWFVGVCSEDNANYVMTALQPYEYKFNADQEIYFTTNAVFVEVDNPSTTYSNTNSLFTGRGIADNLTYSANIRVSGEWNTFEGTANMNCISVNDKEGAYSLTTGISNKFEAGPDYYSESTNLLVFVPSEYLTNEESAVNTMLSIIPIIFFTGLIVSMVGYFAYRKN